MSDNQVYNISTTSATYSLIDNNSAAVNTQITNHINANWANSNNVTESII